MCYQNFAKKFSYFHNKYHQHFVFMIILIWLSGLILSGKSCQNYRMCRVILMRPNMKENLVENVAITPEGISKMKQTPADFIFFTFIILQ